jgi:aspartate-semialdehyde dehydrogenase
VRYVALIILSIITELYLAVLGATGSVGQRFILLLALHPYFRLHAVGASARSAGKKYKDAVRWKQNLPMSKELGELVVRECKAENFTDCDLVFSGLDSDVAGEIGKCSNYLTKILY